MFNVIVIIKIIIIDNPITIIIDIITIISINFKMAIIYVSINFITNSFIINLDSKY